MQKILLKLSRAQESWHAQSMHVESSVILRSKSNIDLTLLACQRPFFLEIDLMKIGVCLFALPLLRLLDL